jgi:hypothetical protein
VTPQFIPDLLLSKGNLDAVQQLWISVASGSAFG